VIQTARRLRASSANVRLHAASRAVVAFAAAQLAAGVLTSPLGSGLAAGLHLALALGLWISFVLFALEAAGETPESRVGAT
jgi:hypothetical protein